MFAIGHFALGYLTGKSSSKALKTKINLPLLLAASVLPDVDLLLEGAFPSLFMHRGPTHSVITITLLIIPFFILYKKQALPYYAAFLSHPLIGDLFTGGAEILWPVSQHWFSYLNINVESLPNVLMELSLFAITLPIMYKTGELQELLHSEKYRCPILIAFGAILGPMMALRYGSEGVLPPLLLAPSLFWLLILAYSMLNGLRVKPVKSTLTTMNPQPAG